MKTLIYLNINTVKGIIRHECIKKELLVIDARGHKDVLEELKDTEQSSQNFSEQ